MSPDADEGYAPPGEPDLLNDDEAYLRVLRSRMPARSQAVIERLNRVNEVYVTCGRDAVLSEAFETFLEDAQSTRHGERKEADIFFLTGESGAGKTDAARRLLRGSELLAPIQTSYGTIRPYVSVKLTGYMLPRIAARKIIAASGHPIKVDTKQGDAWSEMSPALRRRRVVLVHIDEIQHLVTNNSEENKKLADAIKGVSIASEWPVAFLLSGLPGIRVLAKKDEQFERRGNWVHFPDLKMPDEESLVVRILTKMSKAAGLGLGKMSETDMPKRIAHASNYRYARVCQLVRAAIHQALRAKDEPQELLRGHFALAYALRSRARGHNHMNPFLVDDWTQLPRGSFLDVEGPEEDED
ncbi:ATP-binding protein [Methylorubrum extorquens]|uniref:ATP-binding protein n=1 Tax=Methylorubrum extorquens TaxID=408 RepID=UPI003F5E1E25